LKDSQIIISVFVFVGILAAAAYASGFFLPKEFVINPDIGPTPKPSDNAKKETPSPTVTPNPAAVPTPPTTTATVPPTLTPIPTPVLPPAIFTTPVP
jgi:hypothetical protein